jgi:hypothetical protein
MSPLANSVRVAGLVLALASSAHAAGGVGARLDGTRLTIDGDGAPNGVALTGGDQSGDVLVTGLDGTTVNGLASATFAGVRGVTVELGDGADRVELRQVTVRGAVRIRLGKGDDAFVAEQARVRGRLDVRTGRGADLVMIGPQADVGRLCRIRTGRDRDSVVVQSSDLSGLEVSTAGGDDLLALADTRVRGGTDVFAGIGEDAVLLQHVVFQGDVDLNLGEDDDVLELDTVTFEEDADLDGGADADLLSVTGPVAFDEGHRIDDF